MKVKLLTLVALVVAVLSLTGCNREDMEHVKETVSEIDFGDTLEEVKSKREDKPQIEQPGILVYADEFGDYNTLIMYVFNEDGLLKDYFINFTDKYETREEDEKRYKVLQIALDSLYGVGSKPTKEGSIVWEGENNTQILLGRTKDATYILYSNKNYK